MKSPTIGELSHRILFQTPQFTPDGAGGQILTWVTHRTLWGKLTPLQGNEITQGEVSRATTRYQCIIRYDATITTDMRCNILSTAYHIRTLNSLDASRRWLVCHLEKAEGL